MIGPGMLTVSGLLARIRRLSYPPVTLEEIQRELGRATAHIIAAMRQLKEELKMANDTLDRLVQEVEETRGAIASAVVYIKGVPGLVRQAVDDALANNPGLDLGVLQTLADDLDASQAELVTAIQTGSEPQPAPEPEQPADGGTEP
jgi:hypothetical protein